MSQLGKKLKEDMSCLILRVSLTQECYTVDRAVLRTRKYLFRVRIRQSENPNYGSGSYPNILAAFDFFLLQIFALTRVLSNLIDARYKTYESQEKKGLSFLHSNISSSSFW